jgi:erythromycin esterase-like protein
MKISKKLIEKKGFSFIAVEGDWPDAINSIGI